MNKFYNHVISNKLIYVLFALVGTVYLISLYHRYIEDDECILGEYSYYFLHEGIVRVKTMPAILDFDERMFGHHKFYTWSGALFIKIFGWSIYPLKVTTLLWYGLFFFFLYKYFRLVNIDHRKLHFLVASFLIFSAPIILVKSFSFRPDILLMMEGMAVIYFLKKYRIDHATSSVVMAGAFAGLGFLSHLNGIAFCIAGFFFLLIFREFKGLWKFTLVGGLVGSLYFLDLLPPGNFDRFLYQLMNWPTVNHGANYTGDGSVLSIITGRIAKLLSEHQRFFWGDRVLAFSAIFVFGLIFNFKRLKSIDKEVVYFILLLIPALNIFGSHVAERYLLFYYGPMAIISAYWIVSLKQRTDVLQKVVVLLLLVLHLALSGKMFFSIFERNYDAPELHREILAEVATSEDKVLAPYPFVYNEFENYDLYAYKTYEYLQEDREMTQLDVLKKASELGMDYIIVDEDMKTNKLLHWFNGWEIIENPYYEIDKVVQEHLVLKAKDPS